MNELDVKPVVDQFISAVPKGIEKNIKTYGVSDQERLHRSLKMGKIKRLVMDVASFVKDDPHTVFLPEPDFPTTQSHIKVVNANATQRKDGVSPLHLTAWMGDVRLLHFLLQHEGSEINCTTQYGNTPLMEALATTKGDRCACINLLLKFGASVTRPNDNGYTALTLAAWLGDNRVLTKMLERIALVDNSTFLTKNLQTPLMLALSSDHLETAELLIEQATDGAAGPAGCRLGLASKWLTVTDQHKLSALCWAMLNHPQSAGPYIALRMADAHALQKFFRHRLDELLLSPKDELLFYLLYKETLLLLMLKSPYPWLLNLHVLDYLYSSVLWEKPGPSRSHSIITHEAFKKHRQESMLVRLLPWLVAIMMSVLADIPGISLTFLAHPSASADFITVLENIAAEKHNKGSSILSDKPIHFLLLPLFKVPQTCQWIRDEVLSKSKILVCLANDPNSLDCMVGSVAEFLKSVFSTFKFRNAATVLGRETIKQHLIKVDPDTLHKRLEKPWKQLEKCCTKSRTILEEKRLLVEEKNKKANEAEAAKNNLEKLVTDEQSAETSKNIFEKLIAEKKNTETAKTNFEKLITEKKSLLPQVKGDTDKSNVEKRSNVRNKLAQATKMNGCTYIQDPAILASAVCHTKDDTLHNSSETPWGKRMTTLDKFLTSNKIEKNQKQDDKTRKPDSNVRKAPNQSKSKKDADNKASKEQSNMQKHQKDQVNESLSKPFPHGPPTGWLKQDPINELLKNQTDNLPPVDKTKPKNAQKYVSNHNNQNGSPTNTRPDNSTLNNLHASGQSCHSKDQNVTEKNIQPATEQIKAPRQQHSVISHQGQSHDAHAFFPSAYETSGVLQCLESFLGSPNAHGDNEPQPDGQPRGIEQTYEYDDYHHRDAVPLGGQSQKKVSGNMNQLKRDKAKQDGCAASGFTPECDEVITVYDSNENDYGKYYNDVIPMYCPDNQKSGAVDQQTDDKKEIESCKDEDPKSDEFQWNWVPRSKRWREQLKRLVNSKPSQQQRKSNISYLSFSDNTMVIGESSRSKVTVGIHSDGTEVALKRIPRRFLAPTAPNPANQIVQHPNISNYKDWAEDSEYVYVARELCEYSLAEYTTAAAEELSSGDGSAAANKQAIAQQLLQALAALHEAGATHTNLKPQNVLLNGFGNVYLVDMGLWYKDQNSDREDCWVAPEMLQQSQPCYSRASDVFVAGLLVFFALSGGQHPYGSVPPDIQRANVAAGALRVFRGQLSDSMALDLILTCMLMPNPDERACTEDCLRHAYFWDEEKKFDFLSKFAVQPEVKSNLPCSVTQAINSAQNWIGCTNWYEELNKDMKKLAEKLHFRNSCSVTSLLVFITEATRGYSTWPSQLRRRVSFPQRYFIRQYPKLLMPVFEVCRDSPWSKRDALKPFFE